MQFFYLCFLPQFVDFKYCKIAYWSPQISQNVFLISYSTVEMYSSCLYQYPSSCNGLHCDYSYIRIKIEVDFYVM
jgi:hypothetical protein